jgi:TonB family protein
MDIRTLAVACMSALAVCGPASAADRAGARVHTFEVALDAQGAVQWVRDARGGEDTDAQRIAGQLRDWVFKTATAGGIPQPTTTWVRVVTEESADGSAPRLLSATAGPAPERLVQPAYPAFAQLGGKHGVVVLELRMDADGRVRETRVRDTVGPVSRAMANSALQASREWTFRPERVAGVAQAATLLMPVCFTPGGGGQECGWSGPDAQRYGRDTVLALDPVARLTSR